MPLTISRLSASSVVLTDDSACASVCRRVAASDCGLVDVDGRQRPDLDADLVVLDELLGEGERALGHVDGLPGRHEVPVRVADVGQRVGDRGAQLRLGDVPVDAA